MHELCERCWNKGCKENEELRNEKLPVCIDMEENPEHWDFDCSWHPEVDDWWKE